MADQRRFDRIERVVSDTRRELGDVKSTVMARLASHTHAGGGGGAVDSVNGQTGTVVLDAADVGADASGTAAAAVATHEAATDPHPQYTEVAEQGDFPQPVGSANTVGSSEFAARADHIHRLSDDDRTLLDSVTDKLNTADAPELIRDTVGTALVAGTNVTITPDDVADTITISASGGGGSAVDSVNGLTGVVVLDAADVGAAEVAEPGDFPEPIGSSNTVGSSLFAARADHIHRLSTSDRALLDSVTDKLDTSAAPELIRDTVGTALVAGTGVTITPDDVGDTITIAATGGGGGGAVDSVNGETGAVVLDAADVGAVSASRTPDGSMIGDIVFTRMTADQSHSSFSFVSATELATPIDHDGTYVLDAWILFKTDDVARDLFLRIDAATGGTIAWNGIGPLVGSIENDDPAAITMRTKASTESATFGAFVTNPNTIRITGLYTSSGANGSDIVFWFAPTSAGTVTLMANSWVKLTRVA